MVEPVLNEMETRKGSRRTFWRRQPAPPLRPLITAFMARRDIDFRAGMVVFPNAQPEIFAHFGSAYSTSEAVASPLLPLPSMSVLTPRTAPYRHANRPYVDWFLMQLTPLGCVTLLGAPMAALTGPDLALASLIGPSAETLFDELASSRGFDERCDIAEGWVSAESIADSGRRIALSGIVTFARHHSVRSVRQIALHLGVSVRRLRQLFAAEIGMSPKTFFSLVRAERLWTRAHPRSGVIDLFDEFTDQSHAAREFRRFTGSTLGNYLRSKRGGDGLVNGIHIPN